MIDPDTRKRILVAAANLRIARDMLPDSVAVNELSALNEYVQADELVLAIDALCNIGESHHCCGGFGATWNGRQIQWNLSNVQKHLGKDSI